MSPRNPEQIVQSTATKRASAIPPTLEEAAKARPERGRGRPVRCVSHKENILDLLRQRAECGLSVLASELYGEPIRFGRSPRNRISELRKEGNLIEGKPHGTSDWEYRLIRGISQPKRGPRTKLDSRDLFSKVPG